MNPIGVGKAQSRLDKASVLLAEATAARDHPAFVAKWTDFLIALNAVPVILDHSAKGSAKSQAWAQKRCLGKPKDPLVQYLKQARNVEEHGLEETVQLDPGGLAIGINQSLIGGTILIQNGVVTMDGVRTGDGKPIRWKATAPHPKLVPVVDARYGTVFNVPDIHLGQAIDDHAPAAIGELAITYYRALLEEARRLT